MTKPFAPSQADSVLLTATTTSSRVQLAASVEVVRVTNTGTATAFIQFGDASVTATTAKMPVLAGTVETFTKGTSGYVAGITAAGSAALYLTHGEGA